MKKAVIFHRDGKHTEIEVGDVTVGMALAYLKSKGWGSGFLEPEDKVSLLDMKEDVVTGNRYRFIPDASEAPLPDLTVHIYKAKSSKDKEKPKKEKPDHKIILVAPHTIGKLQHQLEDREKDLLIEAYTLSIPEGPELDEQIFAAKAKEHVQSSTPLEIVLASRCVACSSLSNKEGLGLLGLPTTESTHEEQLEGASLNLEEPLPQRLCQGLSSTPIRTVGDLLDHYATDLYLRQLLTDPVDESMKEYTRRELIGPALFLAAHLVGDVRVLAEFAVHGALSKGNIDWLLQYFNFGILCVEGKLYDKLIEHVGQWCGEARALRDELRAQVLGKRKLDEISADEEKMEQRLKEVPTAGLLTSGIHYLFLRYTEVPLKLVTYQRMSLPSSIGTEQCTRDEIKSHLERLVSVLVALLKQQIVAFEEKLPKEVKDAKANKRVRTL